MTCSLLSSGGAADCAILSLGALGMVGLVVVTLSLIYDAFFRKSNKEQK